MYHVHSIIYVPGYETEVQTYLNSEGGAGYELDRMIVVERGDHTYFVVITKQRS